MADSNNNSSSQQQTSEQSSTISYLPILFANGYPTSLERMTAEQLELFIPFLIKCSLNLKMEEEEPKEAPKWWPHSLLEFRSIFEKPVNHRQLKNWTETMKTIVQMCYSHHECTFLLKYSKDLSENDTANLRYVRDSHSTTALWSRNPKKLLLTFRNELMLYDKKKRRQLWKKDESQQEAVDDTENLFDIFLCDCCDATFVSEEAYTEHEKRCNVATEQTVENIVISDDEEDDDNDVEDDDDLTAEILKDQTNFMAYFFLASTGATELPRTSLSQNERSLSPKKKRKTHRTRKVISQKDRERENSIPFSSPAGIVLTKKPIDENYVVEKLKDVESYCAARPNSKFPLKTKHRYQQNSTDTYLMRAMRKTRPYYFPRRHLYSESHQENFMFLNRWLIEDCKPCSIVVAKLSLDEVKAYRERLARLKLQRERANCVDLISDSEEEEEPAVVGVEEKEINEAMTKLNGQFFTLPLPTVSQHPPPSTSSQIIPRYGDFSNFPSSAANLLRNNEIRISRRTIVQHEKTSVSIFQKANDDDSKRSTSIHEWLNNVNGESFNQISHLINS